MTRELKTAAILAGGQSKRFGEDKGLYKLNDRHLIEYALNTLKVVSDEVIIVTNKPEAYQKFDAKVITDKPEFAGLGPLSGLYSALLVAKSDRLLLTACDMPFICPKLINFMWSLSANYDIIVPIFQEKIQPLLAIYHKKIIDTLRKLLLSNKNSLKDLINLSNSYMIPENVVIKHKEKPNPFVNINTKEDLILLNKP